MLLHDFEDCCFFLLRSLTTRSKSKKKRQKNKIDSVRATIKVTLLGGGVISAGALRTSVLFVGLWVGENLGLDDVGASDGDTEGKCVTCDDGWADGCVVVGLDDGRVVGRADTGFGSVGLLEGLEVVGDTVVGRCVGR